MSTGVHYKSGDKFRIGLYFFSHWMFVALLIAMLIAGFAPQLVLGLFVGRMLVQMFIFGRCMKKLNEFDVLWLLPLFDLIVLILYPSLSVSNLIIKEKKWR